MDPMLCRWDKEYSLVPIPLSCIPLLVAYGGDWETADLGLYLLIL